MPLKFSVRPMSFTYRDYQIYELDIDTLKEMRAKFTFGFKKGINIADTIGIDSIKIYNIGDTATYHPKLDIITILNQGRENFNGKNYLELPLINKKKDNSTTLSYIGKDTVNVFPSNYTSESLKNIMFEFKLTIGNEKTRMTVPIGLKVEANKQYDFVFEVTSTIITVTYNVLSWTTVFNNGSEQIIIGEQEYTRKLGTFQTPQWETGNPTDPSTIDN